MGDLSANFSLDEFRCKCGCGKVIVSPDLVTQLQRLRNELKQPIHIVSGYRCPAYNATLVGKGAVSDSEHTTGEGADIECDGSNRRFVMKGIIYFLKLFNRLGNGDTFLHVGVSKTLPQNVEWNY